MHTDIAISVANYNEILLWDTRYAILVKYSVGLGLLDLCIVSENYLSHLKWFEIVSIRYKYTSISNLFFFLISIWKLNTQMPCHTRQSKSWTAVKKKTDQSHII